MIFILFLVCAETHACAVYCACCGCEKQWKGRKIVEHWSQTLMAATDTDWHPCGNCRYMVDKQTFGTEATVLTTEGPCHHLRTRDYTTTLILILMPWYAIFMVGFIKSGVQVTNWLLSISQWKSLTMQEKAKYFQQAKREQLLHKQLYPGWSHGINYVRTTSSNKLLQKMIPLNVSGLH